MATVRLSNIIEPAEFTDYILQETMTKSALVQSGVAVPNSVIRDQITAGAHSFTVPFWHDLADDEADIVNDDPAINSVPRAVSADKQVVRKSFLHQSWSAMNLASEIAGDDALAKIQTRVTNYWTRQLQQRLVASLQGIMADNVANDAGDMVHDISALTGGDELFSAEAVIDTTATMGDAMNNLAGIAMHSDVYRRALKNDLIEFVQQSQGGSIATFRGLAVTVDDGMPVDTVNSNYTTALFGRGAVGYAMAAPRIADGTEVENLPSSGNGGGQQILHSRVNVGLHPAGFSWSDTAVVGESPTVAELADATNWDRIVERKAVPMAFLISKV